MDKPLHERKISEIMQHRSLAGIGGCWIIFPDEIKAWAIAMVKENRRMIGELTSDKGTPHLNLERICQLAHEEEFLMDVFELTEEDLK